MASKKSVKGQLKGDVFLLTGNKQSFASTQIELLKAIHDCGSISKAAKAIGISYKTAWDRIDAMNNMSSQPLVTRSAGGAHGGGTVVTALGQRILEGFQSLQDEHQKYIERLGSKLHSLNDIASFIRSESMKTSARNQFRGTISRITPGAVNAEIEIDIGTAQPIIAIITQDSVERLGLEENGDVIALIKASSVIVSVDTTIVTSARNKFIGKVSRLVAGAVNTDVTLDVGGGKSVCAIITNISATDLGLKEGEKACALFKAPSVILLKDD
ncbi:MAG: TOBE domain-containing protein [Gammaproteobacteria bacterium]|nr:TOBE domain-containing protein [Gammaproteobacteria bacterium]